MTLSKEEKDAMLKANKELYPAVRSDETDPYSVQCRARNIGFEDGWKARAEWNKPQPDVSELKKMLLLFRSASENKWAGQPESSWLEGVNKRQEGIEGQILALFAGSQHSRGQQWIDIVALEAERLEWSKKTFTEATATSSLYKLIDEAFEIEQDIANNKREPMEYADALMCLFDSAGRQGILPTEIFASFKEKLAINKARTWVKNANNTYSHSAPVMIESPNKTDK